MRITRRSVGFGRAVKEKRIYYRFETKSAYYEIFRDFFLKNRITYNSGIFLQKKN